MFQQEEIVQEMPKLQKFAHKLCNNKDEAEDLTQASILRALEKKHLFRDNTDLFKWSSKIMYNLFVSRYRRKVKFETQYDPENFINKQSSIPRQEEVTDLHTVNDAMQKLSDEHRTVLVMVTVKGMKYNQVAETLGVPVGTVRSRLSRAREQLEELLNNENPAQRKAA